MVDLTTHVKKSFKKIRIRPGKIRPSAADQIIVQKNKLLKQGRINESKVLDAQIVKIISKEEQNKASIFRKYCDRDSSNVMSEMWQIKKKMFPSKASALPSAKINYQGKVVTEPKELLKLMGEEFGRFRLRKRPVHPANKKQKQIRKLLLELKLKVARGNKSDPFQMKDLETVLKELKSNKSRGPDGLSRTIFKTSTIGSDLKNSLLKMFNKLKEAGKVPSFMRKATITTIPKKGSKLKLENERGIFLVSTIRSLFMRLMFNMKRSVVDSNMSDSNVGGRKKKSGINHVWIMNNIIYDQVSSVKRTPVIIQKFDYRQMFDGMDSQEASGDIFNYGVNDNYLTIIQEANKEVVISVKTPQGTTKPYTITNKTMQGDTWAPVMASAQVDAFGKEMLGSNPTYMFKFKGEVPIPLLGQVDDLLGVAEAGFKSEQLNAFVNVKTSDKDLQFGTKKCSFMTVSKMKPLICHKSELFVDSWEIKHLSDGSMVEELKGKTQMMEESSLLYLGHVLSKDGKNMPNITHKRNKSISTQKQIVKLVEPHDLYTFQSAVIFIESLLRSQILYASETMVNIKESEYRAIERIEESVIQNIMKTTRSCSRHLLYLETGMIPARFQIQRQVLNLLQYILQQPAESLLFKVFKALENHPTRNDWLTGAKEVLQTFEIYLTIEEIQFMKPSKFKHIVKVQSRKIGFKYLLEKQEQGKKGKLISYPQIQMADYLLPECSLSVKDKTDLFSFRCEVNFLPSNFGNTEPCEFQCQELMNNEHLLSCLFLNDWQPTSLKIEQIMNGNIIEKIDVLRKLQTNTEKLNQYHELLKNPNK